MVVVVSLFALVGGQIPVTWFLLYSAVDGSNTPPTWMTNSWIDSVLLTFWPSAVLLIADPEDSNLGLKILSTLINIGYFGIIGYLFWRGKSVSKKWYFVAAGVFVCPIAILSLI
jgi:hypothetical protein